MSVRFGLSLILAGSTVAAAEIRLNRPLADELRTSHVRFDSDRQVLVAYRDSRSRDVPSVTAVDTHGNVRLQAIPLKDFPRATAVDVWDAAASPTGVVVSAVVQDGKPPRHTLLLYGHAGLEEVWQVNPYHHHKIAVDRAGNVYALGHRIDTSQTGKLIVKYSPGGSVVAEFLAADLLPQGANAVHLGGQAGDNHLWIAGQRLRLYIASTQELFEFDFDGGLKRRVALGDQLNSLAKAVGGTRAQIRMVPSADEPEAMFAQVALWRPSTGYAFGLARLSLDGGMARRVEQGPDEDALSVPLLGKSEGRLFFLDAKVGAFRRR
jgi:hypothetical protein